MKTNIELNIWFMMKYFHVLSVLFENLGSVTVLGLSVLIEEPQSNC